VNEKVLYGFLAWYVALFAVFAAAAVGSVHAGFQVAVTFGGLGSFFLALLAARARHDRVSVPAMFLFLAGLFVVTLLQVVPLPLWIVERLSPHLGELRVRLGHDTSPLAYDGPATLFAAFRLAGLAGFLFAAYQVTRHGMFTQRMMQVLAFGGAILAALALFHELAGISRMYGLFTPQASPRFFLPFVNENHAAGFYGFVFFVLLSLGMGETSPRLRGFTLALAFLPFLAVIWTGSRAGIAALGAGILIWWFLARLARDASMSMTWFGLAFIGLLVSIPLMDFYVVPFLSSPTGLEEDMKLMMWKDAAPLLVDHLWTGVGRGGFGSAYPFYYDQQDRVAIDYVESLPLQFLVDYGAVVASTVLVAGAVVVTRYFRRIRLRVWKVGLIAAVATLVLQNLFDFNLSFFGTALPLTVALGVLSAQRYHGTRRPMRKWVFGWAALGVPWTATVVGAVVAIPLWVWPHRLEVERAKVTALAERREWVELARVAADAQRRHPADYYLSAMRGLSETFVPGGQPLRWIGLASWLFPRHHYPELMAARVLARWNKSSQARVQYARALRKGAPLTWRLLVELRPHVQAPADLLEVVPRPAWNRLADLLPEAEREPVCREMLPRHPDLGPACVRLLLARSLSQRDWPLVERLALLEGGRARGQLRPAALRLAALHGQGRLAEADLLLTQALRQFPRQGIMCAAAMMRVCRDQGKEAALTWARRKLDSRGITPAHGQILLEAMLRLVPPQSAEAITFQNRLEALRRGGRSPADRDLFVLLGFLYDPTLCK
jgi:hypothetical protein